MAFLCCSYHKISSQPLVRHQFQNIYWGRVALIIKAIVYTWTPANLSTDAILCTLRNTEKTSSKMASLLIFRAECRTKDSHGFNSHYFLAFLASASRCFLLTPIIFTYSDHILHQIMCIGRNWYM